MGTLFTSMVECMQYECNGLRVITRLWLQLGSSDELEGKFAQLEGDDVDAELSAMKKGLLSGKSSSKSKQALPEGKSEGGRPYK